MFYKHVDYTIKDCVAQFDTHYNRIPYDGYLAHKTNVRTFFFVKDVDLVNNKVTYDVLVQSDTIGDTRFVGLTGYKRKDSFVKINGKKIFDGSKIHNFPYQNLPHNFNAGPNTGPFPEYGHTLPYYVNGDSIGNYSNTKWYAYEEVVIENDLLGDSVVDVEISLYGGFRWVYDKPDSLGVDSQVKAKRTIKLPRIDRTSYLSELKHGYFDEPISFNVNKRHPSFHDEIFYKVEDSELIPIEYDGNGKCTFTIDKNLMRKFPKKDTANVYIQIVTYTQSGEKLQSDSPLHREVIQINPNLKPTISEFRLRNTNTKIAELLGDETYLQGVSGIKCDLMNETPTFGAEIVKHEVKIDTISKSGTTTIFDPINKTGRIFCTAYLEDSRGRNATYNKTIEFDSYYLPVIQSFFCARKEGSLGRNVTSLVSAKAKPLIKNNVNVNNWNVKIEYSIRRANSWATCYEANVNIENFNQTVPLGDFFDLTTGYDFRLTIADKLYTQVSNISISTINSTMVLGRNNVGIGKAPANHRTLDVEGVTNSSEGFAIDDKPIQNWQLTNSNGLALRTETDCDLILESGFYYVYPATHSPEGRAIYLFVIEGKKGFYAQLAIDQRSRKVYTRTKWTGIAWQSWIECGGGGDVEVSFNDCDTMTKTQKYIAVNPKNCFDGAVGNVYIDVISKDVDNCTQVATDSNNVTQTRTKKNKVWSSWVKLGGIDVRKFDIVFKNGFRPSPYSSEDDNKVIVIGNTAHARLRVDASRAVTNSTNGIANIPRSVTPKIIQNSEVNAFGHATWQGKGLTSVSKNPSNKANDCRLKFKTDGSIEAVGMDKGYSYTDYVSYACWNVGGV